MRTLKLSLILGSTTLLLICLLLFSTHPDKQVYELNGQVTTKSVSPASINVYITQNPSFPASFKGLYHAQTGIDGTFKAEYYGEVNAPFYLYVMKEDSKPVRRVFYPKAEDERTQRLDTPIRFEPIHNGLSIKDYKKEKSTLPFYADECADQAINQVAKHEIHFFENLLERYCSRHQANALEGDVFTKDGPIPRAVFRQSAAQQVSDKLPVQEEGPGKH